LSKWNDFVGTLLLLVRGSKIVETTDEYVMLSALQHFVYCPRQFALIHLEQVWQENIYTLRGLRVHERVDAPSHELIEGVRVERSLSLISHRHQLRGIADVVEFLPDGTPYPVEYKSGARKAKDADAVQLCAQAMCLEEMFDRPVTTGALFYSASKRRLVVEFDERLRSLVTATVQSVQSTLQNQAMPPPVADARCDDCSLLEACLPKSLRKFPQLWDAHAAFRIDELPDSVEHESR
jgi:CRISPR-associated exonuclease Cas4